jgi:hypothetical protein
MTTMLGGPERHSASTKSVPARASSRSSTKEWRGSLPGLTPRLTPEDIYEDFHEELPAVTREMFDKLFREGGILILLPTKTATIQSPEAKVKLCMTPEEAQEFVKGYKAVEGAWFVWGNLFL